MAVVRDVETMASGADVRKGGKALRRAERQSPWLLDSSPRVPTESGRRAAMSMNHNLVARVLHRSALALLLAKAAKLEVKSGVQDRKHPETMLGRNQRHAYLRKALTDIQRAMTMFGRIRDSDLERHTKERLCPLPCKAALGVILFSARAQVMEFARECVPDAEQRQGTTRMGFASLQALEKNLAIIKTEGLHQEERFSLWLAGFPMIMTQEEIALLVSEMEVCACVFARNVCSWVRGQMVIVASRAGLMIETGLVYDAAKLLTGAVQESSGPEVRKLSGALAERKIGVWKGATDAVRMVPQPNGHLVERLLHAFSALGFAIKSRTMTPMQLAMYRTICHLMSDLCVYEGDFVFMQRKLEDAGHLDWQAKEVAGRLELVAEMSRSEVSDLIDRMEKQQVRKDYLSIGPPQF